MISHNWCALKVMRSMSCLAPYFDMREKQCVTRPKIWTKPNPDTFFDTKILRNRYQYFFRYQNFSKPIPILFSIPIFFETDTDTFFETKNFRNRYRYHPNNWNSFETDKFRNQNVTLWYLVTLVSWPGFICSTFNVCFQMFPQIACLWGCKVTLVAFVWLFSTVRFQMSP